jgi:superfamily I DNA/RNA helicase
MQTILDATELPLSVCYRCPTSHLDMARNIVPQIEARDNAPVGIIETINAKDFLDKVTKENNPLILSRTNAYMVGFALQMIANGFKAVIKGRDFGAGLISLVKKLSKSNTSLYTLIDNLTEWKNQEYKKLDSRKAADSAYDIVNDKVDTIIAVSKNCKSVQCIVDKLDKLFNDDTAASFVFSSVHKAKGLEADTVYNLTPHLMPMIRKNQKAWELEQEINIKYVALTRAKNKMVFVNP